MPKAKAKIREKTTRIHRSNHSIEIGIDNIFYSIAYVIVLYSVCQEHTIVKLNMVTI